MVSRGMETVDELDDVEDIDEERVGNASSCMLSKDTIELERLKDQGAAVAWLSGDGIIVCCGYEGWELELKLYYKERT